MQDAHLIISSTPRELTLACARQRLERKVYEFRKWTAYYQVHRKKFRRRRLVGV